MAWSKEKFNENQRRYRQENGNAVTKRYERTKKGKLMRTYRNMISRVNGIQKQKLHLYGGLDILSKEEFYKWSLGNKDFNRIYDEWVLSEYDRKLSPSIDRIDPNKGYILGNMQWLTHSDNSRRGGYQSGKLI